MKFFASDSLNGNDFAPGHQAERHQATIDRAITRSALRIAVKNSNRAGAAIPLGAPFFRSRKAAAPKIFEQGSIRGAVREADKATVKREFDEPAHNGFEHNTVNRAGGKELSDRASSFSV